MYVLKNSHYLHVKDFLFPVCYNLVPPPKNYSAFIFMDILWISTTSSCDFFAVHQIDCVSTMAGICCQDKMFRLKEAMVAWWWFYTSNNLTIFLLINLNMTDPVTYQIVWKIWGNGSFFPFAGDSLWILFVSLGLHKRPCFKKWVFIQ